VAKERLASETGYTGADAEKVGNLFRDLARSVSVLQRCPWPRVVARCRPAIRLDREPLARSLPPARQRSAPSE
jgi:hypothetical protein